MGAIQVLDQKTIDQIAAGEVIERPSSVVKELVENSIDAGATAVTVEIRDGGTSFLRVTDNGSGIEKEQVPLAFLRHSTSKIRRAEDLFHISSLGFRGEALSSIASIAMVELITRSSDEDTGTRCVIEGGTQKKLEETAAPRGTTFLVRNLFYNTPARRKFLKSPVTEGGYISELLERLALSRPDISFQFINNGQTKLHTAGNNNLKDVIYQVYGRDIARNLAEISVTEGPVCMKGFIGKPVVSRGNRGYENYFINGRYIRSNVIARGIEEGYRTFMMQHKYPFTALHFTIDSTLLDVNVHPTKMELRFSNQEQLYRLVRDSVRRGLSNQELIPEIRLSEEKPEKSPAEQKEPLSAVKEPQAAEKKREAVREESQAAAKKEFKKEPEPAEYSLDYFMAQMRRRVTEEFRQKEAEKTEPEKKLAAKKEPELKNEPEPEKKTVPEKELVREEVPNVLREREGYGRREEPVEKEPEQLNLFEKKLLNPETKSDIRIIGQLFETYWLVQFEDHFYMIDQHAAHEKVLYERIVKELAGKEILSQIVSPPLILTLTMQEAARLEEYRDCFTKLGFEIEPFGGKEYALSAVPANLFGLAEKDLFLSLLAELEYVSGKDMDMVLEKIASMSCKAAVKGNQRMSAAEAKALIEELFTLENPYNCPHGRPTIISMTKQEIEKKFKRIV